MTDEWRDVQRALAKLPYIMRDKVVVRAERSAARVIATEAKRRVPVQTGLLKRSIGVAKAKKGDTPAGVLRFYVMTKTMVTTRRSVVVNGQKGQLKAKIYPYYGHMVEFGTKNMTARPFLWPAAKATEALVISTFRHKIHEGVEKELGRMHR